MLEALIEFIYECHHDGKTSGGGMKKELWVMAAVRVNIVTQGYTIAWDKCKNKWGSDIKEKWRHWVILSETSGFGWKEDLELYEAYDYVWDNLNKAHPRIIWHKTHIMYHRDLLSEILHDNQATGQGALPGIDLHIEETHNHLLLDPRLAQHDTEARATTMVLSKSSLPPQFTPKTQYNRSKKRAKAEVLEDDDVVLVSNKRAKVDLGLAILGLSATMEQAIEARGSTKTNSQRAVQLLESVYGERLEMMEFIDGCTFFKDDQNAGIFLSISDIARRDRWLEINLRVELKEKCA
jgi:hypothetical protein